MSISVTTRSRLNHASLGVIDGYEFWDRIDYPEILKQTDDLTYQVVGNERIDSIANNLYGDPTLWWVIALANDLELLPADLNPGAILTIPSPRWVLGELTA